MPTVEGLTPDMVWTTFYGLIAIGLIFLIGYRVYDAIHTITERRKQQRAAETPDFAEKVSQKVIEKLEPRFQEIEANLSRDKKRLENHEAVLARMTDGQKDVHDGLTAICKFMLVISTYGNIGSNEKVTDATAELQKYLAEKM